MSSLGKDEGVGTGDHMTGDWHPTVGGEGECLVVSIDDDGHEDEVCLVYADSSEEGDARARLIAAAPALLVALREYVRQDCYDHHSDDGLRREMRLGNQQVIPLMAARAALTKLLAGSRDPCHCGTQLPHDREPGCSTP